MSLRATMQLSYFVMASLLVILVAAQDDDVSLSVDSNVSGLFDGSCPEGYSCAQETYYYTDDGSDVAPDFYSNNVNTYDSNSYSSSVSNVSTHKNINKKYATNTYNNNHNYYNEDGTISGGSGSASSSGGGSSATSAPSISAPTTRSSSGSGSGSGPGSSSGGFIGNIGFDGNFIGRFEGQGEGEERRRSHGNYGGIGDLLTWPSRVAANTISDLPDTGRGRRNEGDLVEGFLTSTAHSFLSDARGRPDDYRGGVSAGGNERSSGSAGLSANYGARFGFL